MPIIRKKLASSEVYPDDIRYNSGTDEIESLVNGDWVPNPAADPRRQTTLPARITANPACDAAASVAASFQSTISEVTTGIDNAMTVTQIAGLILGLFSFGVFAVFISIALAIADYMLTAGSSAINAALSPTAWDTFICILYCQFGTNGRLKAGGLDIAKSQITEQIGGIGAVLLNSMLDLSGEGGINNLAALGTSSGDCDECGCGVCDVENWSEEYLGTVLERGDGYIIMSSEYAPGIYGTDRIAIGTGLLDTCCCFVSYEWITVMPGGHVEKYIPCGRPLDYGGGGENAYIHGIPFVGQSVYTIGIDCDAPFTIRINLAGC